MVFSESLPNGWHLVSDGPGEEYRTVRHERFVNPEAGLTVEVVVDDDGPEYQIQVLHDGEWSTMLGDCSFDEAMAYARGFMQTVGSAE